MLALITALTLGLSGCVATTLENPADVAARGGLPRRVRVTLVADSIEREVGDVSVARDSIFGLVVGSAAPGHPLVRLAVPLDSVARVRVTRFDPIGSIGTPFLAVIGAGVSYWILAE